MPQLREPALDLHASFVAAMSEHHPIRRGRLYGDPLLAWAPRSGEWQTPEGFAEYLARLRADADPATPQPEGRVPCTTWWWCEGSTFLGQITLRHRLTTHLLHVGGHIGYSVRPTARRQGHATAMLAAVLPHAHRLGIDPVLVTCDVDNLASRRIIEANGGVLEDERQGKLRYWIRTAGSTPHS